jgi:hypothetical protein
LTVQDDIANLGDLLYRLRATDRRQRVFGSDHHASDLLCPKQNWWRSSPLTAHRVAVPEDYRHFLGTVGNGGAGPFYGLEPLGSFGRDLSEPLPFTHATDELTEEELEQFLDPHAASQRLEALAGVQLLERPERQRCWVLS